MSRSTRWYLDGEQTMDYQFNFERPLSGDSIASVNVEVVGVVDDFRVTKIRYNDLKVNVWLTGGITSRLYRVKCTVTTDQGRSKDFTQVVQITNT